MKHLFIVNPTAGKGNRLDELVSTIHRSCSSRKLDYEIYLTTAKGDAERTSHDRVSTADGQMRVYVCGGDGTLNEVVNGVAGLDNCAITALPLGSGNDFLKLFGEDVPLFRSFDTLLDDTRETPFDLIQVNDRYSLNICSIGLDARIGIGMANWKKIPFVRGVLAYLLSTLCEVLKGIAKPMTVSVPDEAPVSASYSLICACNGRAYGGTFCPYPKAMPDDGVLHFIIVPKLHILKVAQLIARYAAGQVEKYRHVVRLYDGTALTISTPKPYLMQLDGEALEGTEFRIRLSQHKLRFFYPAKASYQPK